MKIKFQFTVSIQECMQGRHGQFLASKDTQWQPHQRCAAAATAAFYSAKSRQGPGLGCRGGPGMSKE